MMPLHFAVKFLNLEMASFITLLGLSSPETNITRSVSTPDSLAKYASMKKRVRHFVICTICSNRYRVSLSPKATGCKRMITMIDKG